MSAKDIITQCVICGKDVSGDGNDAVTLSDKGRICRDCAAGIRMVWPTVSDEAKEHHITRGMPAYNHTDIIDVLVDSLENATTDNVRAAVAEAETIREEYRAKYGDVKGLFLVDTVLRESHVQNKSGLVKNSEELERVFAKQLHIIRGRCVYGQVHTDDTFEVARREKTYFFKPYDLGEGKFPDAKLRLPEGRYGEYYFMDDVSCIYPGDMMIVR